MKPWILTAGAVAALATSSLAVMALRRPSKAPEVVAEPLPAAAPSAVPVTAPQVSAAPPVVAEDKPVPLPGSRAMPSEPRADDGVPPAPRAAVKGTRKPRCPPGIVADGETYLRQHGRCPPTDTPLVLSFDGAPVAYLADRAHGFDLNGARSQVTDWPTARTPWLALDRDGDGRIADGSELFGSMTVLSTGERAANGFAALRELDADGDGRITPRDPGFARLLVWSDGDGDRRSAPGELVSAAEAGLLSIDLDYVVDPRCDARGDCEVERAVFRYRDGAGVERTGAVIDVHLAAQP
jgi:hypothetical protein